MNSNNEFISTPRNTRTSLGLRKRATTTVPNIRLRKDMFERQETENSVTPTNTKKEELKAIDTTPRTRNSTKKVITQQPLGTPRNIGLKRLTESTNCRPYRLTLNRNIREKLTKKRLEFHIANEAEKHNEDEVHASRVPELHPSSVATSDSQPQPANSRQEIILKIKDAQLELKKRETHLVKANELKNAISIWKTAFASAVDDLQQKIEPPIDKADLLQQLGIQQSMLQYVND